MRNRTAIMILVMMFLTFVPISTNAAVLSCFSTTSETNYLWADATYGDDQFTRVDYNSSGSNTIEWYRLEGGSAVRISSSSVSGTGTITPPSNAAALKLRSNSGGLIYLTYAETNNPSSSKVSFNCDSEEPGGVPGNSGDCGCIFRTPGWQDYVGKIDDILAAIPPVPDWGKVAGTFRDTIVPSLIGGVDDMLGRAPSLPSQPKQPSPLDDGDLKKPNGQDSGLEGFDENDIKDGDQIEFKEDESGGWDILDPIESMPEQETFIPEEGDLEAPKDPEEPENPAPTPEEPENPAPTPEEPENPAPTPNEPENPAPTPGEPENPFPTPNESENPAPTPGENGGNAPIPGGDFGGFPMPGADNGGFPMPGRDNGNFPIP